MRAVSNALALIVCLGAGAFAADNPPNPACEALRSSDTLLGALSAGGMSTDTLKVFTSHDRELSKYLGCLALASQSDDACAHLGELDRAQKEFSKTPALPFSYMCRMNASVWRHDHARITHAEDVIGRCIAENSARLPGDGGPLKPGTFKEGCPLLARYAMGGQDAAVVCGELKPYFRYEGGPEVCIDLLHYVNGEDPDYCSHVRQPHTPERCRYLAAYRKAFDDRNAKACADDPLCRVQMGAGTSGCEVYRKALQTSVCGAGKPSI